MKEIEKQELRRIIKDIPQEELNGSISGLWIKYGFGYTYETFRNYLKTFAEMKK